MQRRCAYEELLQNVQASDGELAAAMKVRRILSVDGCLRTLSPRYMNEILTLILNCLVARSLPSDSADVEIIMDELHALHDVKQEVTKQVLKWFGEVNETTRRWKCCRNSVVAEIGIGLLLLHKNDYITERSLIKNWKGAVGDTFEDNVDLGLLTVWQVFYRCACFHGLQQGNYISEERSGIRQLKYFAASELPSEPKARFTDLFLTRARWHQDDIIPFIEGITVDKKDRDRMLLKFTRSTKDTGGTIWLTAIHK